MGNKPATCRAYYVHPCVIETYLDKKLPSMKELVEKAAPPRAVALGAPVGCGGGAPERGELSRAPDAGRSAPAGAATPGR